MEKILSAPAHSSDQTFVVSCGRDKSLTHRAIMFASLAKGKSLIRHPLLGADCLSTLSCFEALGVKFEIREQEAIEIVSEGYDRFCPPTRDLDCGNSGTTARLILGILAAQKNLNCRLTGDASLSSRPMKRVVTPLRAMGAQIDGPDEGNFLPLTIEGRTLAARSHHVDKASAQVKSCLLLAGLFCQGETQVELPAGSRDHTERVLAKMGADINTSHKDGIERIQLKGPFAAHTLDAAIPVDPSSAAFFAVLGLLRKKGRLELPDMLDNETRTGFVRVLKRMSPSALHFTPSSSEDFVEPVGLLTVTGGHILKGTDITAAEVPTLVDEIPILAVAAAFAEGPSHFQGLAELRVKESDRLKLTSDLLNRVGARHEVRGDDLIIQGGLREIPAFRFDPEGDHRLAMSAAILARLSQNPCCILDSECVRVSFPNFFESLESITSN